MKQEIKFLTHSSITHSCPLGYEAISRKIECKETSRLQPLGCDFQVIRCLTK